jgi:hypothetical protein
MGMPLKNRVFVKNKIVVVIAIVLIFGLLVLNMLIVHREHAKSYKVKMAVAKQKTGDPVAGRTYQERAQ